jgi:hypothetical protein
MVFPLPGKRLVPEKYNFYGAKTAVKEVDIPILLYYVQSFEEEVVNYQESVLK